MAKTYPLITNFSKGEASPLLSGRVDFKDYYNSASTLQNWFVIPQGGVTKANGTKYLSRCRTDSEYARLIPFEFSTTQSYALEFNGGKMRVYKDSSAVLETAKNITGITQANPAVVTSNSHGFSNGDEVYITGVVGMTQVNGKRFRVANQTANTFELTDYSGANVNSTSYTAYSSGGTVARVYEITIPYTSADLSKLQFAQDDDIMYIVHPSYAPRKLTRSGHTSWTLSTITYDKDNWPPFMSANTNTTHTMHPSGATGSITVTSSTSFFTSGMVGGYLRVVGGYIEITGYTSGTVISGTVISTVLTTPQTDWSIGAFHTAYGFPSAVTFYEQRLAYASTSQAPQTTWLSQTERYEHFKTGTADSDGLLYVLATEKVCVIEWLFPSDRLILGTSYGPFNLGSGNDTEPLTPTNVVVRKAKSGYKCSEIMPVTGGDQLYYVQTYGRKIREYFYEFSSDAFKAQDITIISEHITSSGVVEMAYQQSPLNMIYCVLANGKMAVLTREADQQIFAWTKLTTDGTFENICCIPNRTGGYDEVYVVVKRTIGGVSRRYVEVFTAPFTDDTAQEDAFFVHSGLTYDGTATSTVTGLDHLEGKSVTVYADGAYQNNKTVSGGSITLDHASSVVQVGLGYDSIIKLQPVEYGSANGSAQAKWKRITDIFIRFYRSLGCSVGIESIQDDVPFRSTNDPMDTAPPLFTGDKRVSFRGGWDRDQQIYIKHSLPAPCTILRILLHPIEVSE